MTDITSRSLDAAIIDQKVAGAFADKRYAFVAVRCSLGSWQLAVAVLNEDGYNPIDGKRFETSAEAHEWADDLNAHIGLSQDDAARIVASTMRGSRLRSETW